MYLPLRKYVIPGGFRKPYFLAISRSFICTILIPYSAASSSINSICLKTLGVSGSSSLSAKKTLIYRFIFVQYYFILYKNISNFTAHKRQLLRIPLFQCILQECPDQFPLYSHHFSASPSSPKLLLHQVGFLYKKSFNYYSKLLKNYIII